MNAFSLFTPDKWVTPNTTRGKNGFDASPAGMVSMVSSRRDSVWYRSSAR